MNKYTMSPEEKDNFYQDEIRDEVRKKASLLFTTEELVYIVDENDEIWDQAHGVQEPGADEVLSAEEIQQRAEREAAELAEAEKLETVIRPLAMKRLRAEARDELRDELRSKTNEILKLRADLSRSERRENFALNEARAELAGKRAEVIQLKNKISVLESEHESLVSQVKELQSLNHSLTVEHAITEAPASKVKEPSL